MLSNHNLPLYIGKLQLPVPLIFLRHDDHYRNKWVRKSSSKNLLTIVVAKLNGRVFYLSPNFYYQRQIL